MMTNKKHKSTMSPVKIGAISAAVVATGAIAVVMANKKVRHAVAEKLTGAKDYAVRGMDTTTGYMYDTAMMQRITGQKQGKAKKAAKKSTKSSSKTTKKKTAKKTVSKKGGEK